MADLVGAGVAEVVGGRGAARERGVEKDDAVLEGGGLVARREGRPAEEAAARVGDVDVQVVGGAPAQGVLRGRLGGGAGRHRVPGGVRRPVGGDEAEGDAGAGVGRVQDRDLAGDHLVADVAGGPVRDDVDVGGDDGPYGEERLEPGPLAQLEEELLLEGGSGVRVGMERLAPATGLDEGPVAGPLLALEQEGLVNVTTLFERLRSRVGTFEHDGLVVAASICERLGSGSREGEREQQGGQKGLGVQRLLLLDNRSSGFVLIQREACQPFCGAEGAFRVRSRYVVSKWPGQTLTQGRLETL